MYGGLLIFSIRASLKKGLWCPLAADRLPDEDGWRPLDSK